MFVRRGRRRPGRWDRVRIGLLFLAAGTWLGGVIADLPVVTGAAIGIVVVALLLGLVDRGEADDDAAEGD